MIDERIPAQDGSPFAVFPEADMPPVCVQGIGSAQAVADYLGCIRVPVAVPVVPELPDFL